MGFAGLVLLLLPLVPGPRRQHQRRAHLDPARLGFSFQPGEIAKICLAIFFAGYLVVKRDALALAGRRFMGIDLPRGRDLGPILLMWLISLGVLGLPATTSARRCCSSACSSCCSTSPPSGRAG